MAPFVGPHCTDPDAYYASGVSKQRTINAGCANLVTVAVGVVDRSGFVRRPRSVVHAVPLRTQLSHALLQQHAMRRRHYKETGFQIVIHSSQDSPSGGGPIYSHKVGAKRPAVLSPTIVDINKTVR